MQKSSTGEFAASETGLIFELIILFAATPALFLTDVNRVLRTTTIAAVVLYVLLQSTRRRLLSRSAFGFAGFRHWKRVLVLFSAFALVSAAGIAVHEPSLLLRPVRLHPRIWLTFLLVYCVFSVYPQTVIFRGFFLERYATLFPNRCALVVSSAIAFAWAHTIIAHPFVYALSFCGGILFSTTYLRSRSLTVSAIEHALYGSWLFTVGLGPYFAFPL